MDIQFPPFLQKGDKVVIVSPSSKIDQQFLKGAKKRMESWGLKVAIGKHAGSSSGRYAGTIKQRLKDLQDAMDDPKVKAILCSRGGYGAVHLIDKIDFTAFCEQSVSEKWICFPSFIDGTSSYGGTGRRSLCELSEGYSIGKYSFLHVREA